MHFKVHSILMFHWIIIVHSAVVLCGTEDYLYHFYIVFAIHIAKSLIITHIFNEDYPISSCIDTSLPTGGIHM